ncbi:hypothetical protein BOTNAR_0043g00160 [Botryotinia narcissicola]|uniref:Uncharacterized protein n=1 Tax=Botryotinia narcissicola TaxID=278944 RepID=A0A4Z1J2I2_9HELO|nr:hypothetical protein BOTNAR_0043g00160 [Botryotinia narcissicola]
MATSTLLLIFKAISIIFGVSTVITGIQALLNPIAFSKTFGITVPKEKDTPILRSYITLMATRQLATGTSVLLLARIGYYISVAYILMVAGIIVAGTDGVFIAKNGSVKMGIVHAGPGFVIAAVAAATIWLEESVKTVEQQKEFVKNCWRGKVEDDITAAAAVFWIVAAGTEKAAKEAKPIPPVRNQPIRLSSPHPANYLRLNKTQLHRLPVKIHKLRDASTQVSPPPKLLRSTVTPPATSKLESISPIRTGDPHRSVNIMTPPPRVIRTTRATMLRQIYQLRTHHNTSNRDLLLKAVVLYRVLRAREKEKAMLPSSDDEANLGTVHKILSRSQGSIVSYQGKPRCGNPFDTKNKQHQSPLLNHHNSDTPNDTYGRKEQVLDFDDLNPTRGPLLHPQGVA